MEEPKLVSEIISLVIESVNLHHVPRSSITSETSLRAGGLELDSIDLLELVVAVEQKYGVKVKDPESGKVHFRTIGAIANFVSQPSDTTAH